MDELGIPHRWKVVPLDEASNLLAARLVDLLQGIEHGSMEASLRRVTCEAQV